MKQMTLARGGFERFGKTTKRAVFLAEMDRQIFEGVGTHLQAKGFRLSTGTIVDATLIAAPSSTKNSNGERDPEMKQSRKGKQWYFGMKAHVAVDAKSKLIHHVVATSGAVADGKMLPNLLHGKETAVWGDSAYTGQTKVIEEHAPWAQDLTQRRDQAHLRLREGALPRPCQERQPAVRCGRARQFLHGS